MVVPAGPPAGLGTGGWEAKSLQSGENRRHNYDPICSTFTLYPDFVNRIQSAI